jgi:hypothetical protein
MTTSRRVPGALLVALLAVMASPRAQHDFELMLRQAIENEEIAGNLPLAIEQYRSVAEGPNRVLAAQALLRLATAHRTRGDRQAEEVLGRIVRDYPEQPAAAEARAQLDALARTGAPDAAVPTSQTVWTIGGSGLTLGRVSRDGRWLPYVDWSTHNLMLRDLVANRDVQATDGGVLAPIREQQ